MKGISLPLAGMILLVLVSSCGPKKLTRGGAERILNTAGSKASLSAITLSLDQIIKLTHLSKDETGDITDKMSFVGAKPCVPDATDVRIAFGSVVHCEGYVPATVTHQRPGAMVKFTKPVGWKIIEVTGISDDSHAPNDKIVEYTWKYELSDFSKPVQEIFNPTPPYQGKALLRLYDDGWRFVDYQ